MPAAKIDASNRPVAPGGKRCAIKNGKTLSPLRRGSMSAGNTSDPDEYDDQSAVPTSRNIIDTGM